MRFCKLSEAWMADAKRSMDGLERVCKSALQTAYPTTTLVLIAGLSACQGGRSTGDVLPAVQTADQCEQNQSIVFSRNGTITPGDAKTYQLLPVEVPAGASRIEVGYSWSDNLDPVTTPLTQTVVDLGLWDADGYRSAEGFRGWSGSRQGKLHEDQPPIWVSAHDAERGYLPGALEPGLWHIELGIAAVGPAGGQWTVEGRIDCTLDTQPPPIPDPVDPAHVANNQPGWYRGDFHMHGYHSNPKGPQPADLVRQARDAQLDFLMITEYVTGRHWQEWGQTQRDNPNLLIWPGREIITYYGHANALGETPNVLEYRHGFEDVNLADIQRATKADGALFQVNHPTTFPGPVFSNFCRGCEFTLGDQIAWSLVDTVEIVSGPMIATGSDLGLPLPAELQNPFTRQAIKYWEDLLLDGYRIAAVSGSDFKGTSDDPAERRRAGYGSSATVVYAQSLSREGITQALKAGRSYVQARGALDSPQLAFFASDEDGQQVMFGGTLSSDTATLRSHITGGNGQTLSYVVNGRATVRVPITSDDFSHELAVGTARDAGPLGTFWRIETRDRRSLTSIGSPIYLQPENGSDSAASQ